MPKFLTPINMTQQELQNAVIQNLATAPSSPKEGQIYQDTTTHKTYIYNGTIWEDITGSSIVAALSGDITTTGSSNITTLKATGTAGTYTKVTTDAQGRVISSSTLIASDIPTLTASKISDFQVTVNATPRSSLAVPTVDISMNSKKITSLADPISGTDAVNKNYADGLRAGISLKDPVRVATTANITLSAPQTIDGVAVIAGDRVLVKNQTTASGNGIYVVAASTWARSTDADLSSEVVGGMAVWVNEGTVNADSRWVLTTNNTITLGTTSLVFTKDFQAADIVAGAGLTKSGNQIDVVGGTGITVNANNIQIDTNVVARRYTASLGNGVATSIVATHSFANQDVAVTVRESASPYNIVYPDVQISDANSVTILFAIAPTTSQYRVIITG